MLPKLYDCLSWLELEKLIFQLMAIIKLMIANKMSIWKMSDDTNMDN